MNTFRTITRPVATLALLLAFPASMRAEEAPPKHLEFSITKGITPGSDTKYTGAVSFGREDVTKAFKVTWKLSDGSTQSGWGVAYPKSGYMAVAYGSEATGVAIYKLNEKGADARWALAKEEAEVGSYELKRGQVKYEYVYKDGTPGSIRIEPTEVEGVANVSFKTAAGGYGGIGVTDGDYLAVGAASGTKDFGVVIYHTDQDMNVTGRWIVAGAPAVGTEDLTIVSVDGQKITEETAAAPPARSMKDAKAMTRPDAAGANQDLADKDLAAKIALDLEKCSAVGEYFIEQVQSDDMDSITGLMDDRAFDEKISREAWRATMEKSSRTLGRQTSFKPDKDKVDFGAAKGGGMNFTLEGDATYEKGNTHEKLTFFKPQGGDKVVIVGYERILKK